MPSIAPFFAVALAVSVPVLAAEPIALPHFDLVELNGGGEVTVVPGPVQRVTLLSGSTQFTSFRVVRGGKLEIATRCNAACPQRYDLRIRVESPRVPDVAIKAGGAIVAGRGFAPQREIGAAISAGGTIDLRAVAADSWYRRRSMPARHLRPPAAKPVRGGQRRRRRSLSGNPSVSMAVRNGGTVRRDD